MRSLAEALVRMPVAEEGYDELLVRAARKAATLSLLERQDRVAQALLALALKLGIWRSVIGHPGGVLPGVAEKVTNEVLERRYELAEALGATLEEGSAPVFRGPCRMGGEHQRYPGSQFPHACMRCARYVENWA